MARKKAATNKMVSWFFEKLGDKLMRPTIAYLTGRQIFVFSRTKWIKRRVNEFFSGSFHLIRQRTMQRCSLYLFDLLIFVLLSNRDLRLEYDDKDLPIRKDRHRSVDKTQRKLDKWFLFSHILVCFSNEIRSLRTSCHFLSSALSANHQICVCCVQPSETCEQKTCSKVALFCIVQTLNKISALAESLFQINDEHQ